MDEYKGKKMDRPVIKPTVKRQPQDLKVGTLVMTAQYFQLFGGDHRDAKLIGHFCFLRGKRMWMFVLLLSYSCY